MSIFGRSEAGTKGALQLVQRGTDKRIPVELVKQPSGEVLEPTELEGLHVMVSSESGTGCATIPHTIEDGKLVVEITADISRQLGLGVYTMTATGRIPDPAYADGYHDYEIVAPLCKVTKYGNNETPVKVTANVMEGFKGEKGEQGIPGQQGPIGPAGPTGPKGKSAYQSYLDTTTDKPLLTEEQWAKVNDYHTQILHAIIHGTKDMTEKYTGAELYDLSKHLRKLNSLLQSRGVGVTEESPLVDLIKAIELAPSFPEAVPVYKDQQFDSFPNASIAPVIFSPIYGKAYYTFWKSKLQALPPLLSIDKVTSTEGMCDSSDVLGVAKVGEAVSLTRMDRMFYGCVSLSVVHISTSPALVNMEMAFGNCGALTSIVGVIDVSNVTRSNNAFLGCTSLVDVKLKGLSNAIDLNNCRDLSAESLRYLVDNAQRVTAKTITLSSRLSSRSELKETLEYVGAKAVEKGFSVIYR